MLHYIYSDTFDSRSQFEMISRHLTSQLAAMMILFVEVSHGSRISMRLGNGFPVCGSFCKQHHDMTKASSFQTKVKCTIVNVTIGSNNSFSSTLYLFCRREMLRLFTLEACPAALNLSNYTAC